MSAAAMIEVQVAGDDGDEPPQPQQLRDWAAAALAAVGDAGAGVTLRIVSAEESRELNRCYRGRDAPTNVLSFPFGEVPPEAIAELGGP